MANPNTVTLEIADPDVDADKKVGLILLSNPLFGTKLKLTNSEDIIYI